MGVLVKNLKYNARTGNYDFLIKTNDGKTVRKATTLDEDRIRFNWGYHDGNWEAGRGKIRDVGNHYDPVYASGYVEGVKSFKRGTYSGNSESAWIKSGREEKISPYK